MRRPLLTLLFATLVLVSCSAQVQAGAPRPIDLFQSLMISPEESLVITNPENDSRLNVTNVTVTWRLANPSAVIVYYMVKLDDDPWVYNADSKSKAFVDLDEGWHVVLVEAWSEFGPEYQDQVTFEVDVTPPTVTSYSPMGGDVPLFSEISVSFSEDMDHDSIIVHGVSGQITWGYRAFSLVPYDPLLPNRTYAISVKGEDMAGNALGPFSWSFQTTNQGSIKGQVRDERNYTVSGAMVELSQGGLVVASTTTDNHGDFSLNAPAGRYNLTISSSEIQTSVQEVMVTAGTTTDLDIVRVGQVQSYAWVWIDFVIVLGAISLFLVGMRRQRIAKK